MLTLRPATHLRWPELAPGYGRWPAGYEAGTASNAITVDGELVIAANAHAAADLVTRPPERSSGSASTRKRTVSMER
jgi:hypothetical protein